MSESGKGRNALFDAYQARPKFNLAFGDKLKTGVVPPSKPKTGSTLARILFNHRADDAHLQALAVRWNRRVSIPRRMGPTSRAWDLAATAAITAALAAYFYGQGERLEQMDPTGETIAAGIQARDALHRATEDQVSAVEKFQKLQMPKAAPRVVLATSLPRT